MAWDYIIFFQLAGPYKKELGLQPKIINNIVAVFTSIQYIVNR